MNTPQAKLKVLPVTGLLQGLQVLSLSCMLAQYSAALSITYTMSVYRRPACVSKLPDMLAAAAAPKSRAHPSSF